eukprot:2562196-Ditylum_brightwellii.AAC.1
MTPEGVPYEDEEEGLSLPVEYREGNNNGSGNRDVNVTESDMIKNPGLYQRDIYDAAAKYLK